MEEAKFEIESKRLFQEAKPTLFRVAYFDLFLYFWDRTFKFFHTYGMEEAFFTFYYLAWIPTGFISLTNISLRLCLLAGDFFLQRMEEEKNSRQKQ